VPLPATAAVWSDSGVPEQPAVALGPYKLNVIVPVGEEPPDRTAVSCTVVPTGPPGLGVVEMAGEDLDAPSPRRVERGSGSAGGPELGFRCGAGDGNRTRTISLGS
jgi:hypothetical protein